MAVKSKRYRQMLEMESRKKQPLMKANLKAGVMAGAYGEEANKYDRPTFGDKVILAILKARKKGKKNGKGS